MWNPMSPTGDGVKSLPIAPQTDVGSGYIGTTTGPVVASPDYQTVPPRPALVSMISGWPGSTSAPMANLPFWSVKVRGRPGWLDCMSAYGEGTQESSGSCIRSVPVTFTGEKIGFGLIGSSTILVGKSCAASTFAVLDIRAYCWSPENCAVIGSGTSSLVIQVNWPAELVNKSAESPVAPSSDETETLAPAIICGGEVVVSSTPFTVTSPPG